MRNKTFGCRARNGISEAQWVVASWPSSRPVSAISMPPEQAEQIVAPPSCIFLIHRTMPG